MRRVQRLLLVFSFGFAASGLAEAGDALVMPYECGLHNGRVQLSPGPAKSYPIVGKREELAVTTCRSQTSDGCRTVMAHRFVISCGAAGVPWVRVAAAIQTTDTARAWIETGRLNLILYPRQPAEGDLSCIDRPTYALGRTVSTRSAGTQDCRPSHQEFEHVVLPPGYAPVGELGARLDIDPAGGPAYEGSSVTVVAGGPGESVVARAVSTPGDEQLDEPIPGLEPYDPNFDTSGKVEKWVTVVRATADYGIGEHAGDTPVWLWLLLTMALATAAGLTRVKLAYGRAGGSLLSDLRVARLLAQFHLAGWSGHRRAAPEIETRTESGAAVAPLLARTAALVEQLKGGGPLREVLLGELDQVRQRLETVEETAAESQEEELRAAPVYRALVRELERIRRIADGAAASLARTPGETAMPATRSEAFAVLGVNPDVSDGVLKKIVDGLRMSWHPDHARDEDDRRTRETRIRQINIAWDLITARHDPA